MDECASGVDVGVDVVGVAGTNSYGADENEGKNTLWLSNLQLVVLLAIYALVYVVGKRRNREICRRWLQCNMELFVENFHLIGVVPKRIDKLEDYLEAVKVEGPRHFKFYATGRRFCKCCLVELDLKPRQDLLSMIYSLFNVWEDTFTVDVPMDDRAMDPFVFSLVRRADLPFMKKVMFDVAFYTRQVPLELLPKSLWCLTDCSELVTHFLSPKVVQVLTEFEEYIEWIHISDQNTRSGFGPNVVHAKALRFRFKLPHSEEICQVLMSLVFDFIDLVGSVRIPPSALRHARSQRAKARKRLNLMITDSTSPFSPNQQRTITPNRHGMKNFFPGGRNPLRAHATRKVKTASPRLHQFG